VYFLNAVTESDLVALAEKADKSVSESVIPTTATPKPDPTTVTAEPGTTATTTTTPAEPVTPAKSNSGMIIFVVIACVALGGAGYCIKIVRPKKQAAQNAGDDEDEEIAENRENDEDIPYEDEPEDNGHDVIETDDAEDYAGESSGEMSIP